MIYWPGVASLILLAGPAAAASASPWNPYAPPSDEFEERLRDAAFGVPGADRALQDWLVAHPQLAAERRIQGYNQLCVDYDVLTWNRLRAPACTEYARLKTAAGIAKSGDDDETMALVVADQPPVRAIGSARVSLTWNIFGSQSVGLVVNDVRSSWFVDTGAQITVVAKRLADRMRIRIIGSDVRVGTTTADVRGEVGMIDRLEIGSATAENVPVLILPDDRLKLGNVHQIEGILGLQVMVAFGRVAWVNGGSQFALGEAAPKARPTATHIYWDEEGLGVPVRTARGVMGAFLDTGANATHWRPAGLPLLDPILIASAKEQTSMVGGAGGVIELKERYLQDLSFELGALPVRLKDVSLPSTDKNSAAQVGMDAVSEFGTFILDFEQMRLDGKLKTPAERKRTHKKVITEEDVRLDGAGDKEPKPPQ